MKFDHLACDDDDDDDDDHDHDVDDDRLLAVRFSLEVCAGSRIEKLGRGGLGTRGEWRARSLLVQTPIFSRTHGINTRRILREKRDCKQSNDDDDDDDDHHHHHHHHRHNHQCHQSYFH